MITDDPRVLTKRELLSRLIEQGETIMAAIDDLTTLVSGLKTTIDEVAQDTDVILTQLAVMQAQGATPAQVQSLIDELTKIKAKADATNALVSPVVTP